MSWPLSPRVDLHNDRISKQDADRQMHTAAEILRRLERQPGVVLADEVGMGKTFVALAVSVSVVGATGGARPVVVMIPPGVQDKWPREWDVFRQECLRPGGRDVRASAASVNRGSDFLKLLDDPADRRRHIVFLTHGALTSSLADPFVRLAIVRRAMQRRPALAKQRKALPRWAGQLFAYRPFRDQRLVTDLLETHPRRWARVWARHTRQALDDDPVPDTLLAALELIDLAPLVDALASLPLYQSAHIDARLRQVRVALTKELDGLWRACLGQLDVRLPLLILDEAHHLKNPWTKLAGLFANPQAEQDADALRGPFGGVFERMLFLTATPFQLGHRELLQVLGRFNGIRWTDGSARADYAQRLEELTRTLDAAQAAALRLDQVWGQLAPDELTGLDETVWSSEANSPDLPEPVGRALASITEVRERIRAAEQLLAPWVIRHLRPHRDQRRLLRPGRAILDGDQAAPGRGLEVQGAAVLPFLLAARAQAVVALDALYGQGAARAYFAEGLASSFEAYRETRQRDHASAAVDEDAPAIEPGEISDEVLWYLRQIDRFLPADDEGVWSQHPKIAATVTRTLERWQAGEKVLVFCFYVATGRALRNHTSRAIRQTLIAQGAAKLGLPADDPGGVMDELDRLGERFFDPAAPVTRAAREAVTELLGGLRLRDEHIEQVGDIALRFLRTPSFLVRYVDLADPDQAAALQRGLEVRDSTGLRLQDKIRSFGALIADRVPEERDELLGALETMQTGLIFAQPASMFDPSEQGRGRKALLPNVRLANGGVARDVRRRLMLAFNSPFFPEVLIASAVMAEGVDLHLDCRHVIHHDLDWNPSVLEQRTGRLDRLGSKAEASGQPIVVYEPYLEATQDEKQYRVVKDRERWFNIVMGGTLQLDESSTDRLARRVPLPEQLARELTLHLAI
jgi:Helicase conserved C-terminal domain